MHASIQRAQKPARQSRGLWFLAFIAMLRSRQDKRFSWSGDLSRALDKLQAETLHDRELMEEFPLSILDR
jgi:hypothetical protein